MNGPSHVLDQDREAARAEEAELQQNLRESRYYRLLRSVLLAQAAGDFDRGEKLQQCLFEDGEPPKTPQQFDSAMERALKLIGDA